MQKLDSNFEIIKELKKKIKKVKQLAFKKQSINLYIFYIL